MKALVGAPVILTLSAGSAFGAPLSGGSLFSACAVPRGEDAPPDQPQFCPDPPPMRD